MVSKFTLPCLRFICSFFFFSIKKPYKQVVGSERVIERERESRVGEQKSHEMPNKAL